MKEFIRKYFPLHMHVPVLMLIISNLGIYYGAKVINELLGRTYLDMTGVLELATPTLPGFSFVYVAAFPFWYISYYLLCRHSRELCCNLVFTDVLAKILCGVIFILIPTTNVRPVLADRGLSNALLGIIYANDTPVNLFPSIHCLESWLLYKYIRDLKECPKWVKISIFVLTIAICMSTVFIRQHVWIDVFAGIFVAEFCRAIAPLIFRENSAVLVLQRKISHRLQRS